MAERSPSLLLQPVTMPGFHCLTTIFPLPRAQGNPANGDPQSWTSQRSPHGQGYCPTRGETPNNNTKQTLDPCPFDPKDYPNDAKALPDNLTLQDAKELLAEAARHPDTPFWIGVGFVKPHLPFVYPAEFERAPAPRASMRAVENPLTDTTQGARMNWASTTQGFLPPVAWQRPYNRTSSSMHRQQYYAAAAYTDSLLGELLAEVARHGFDNNTIVVRTSDHGWGLGEHNHWVKNTLWETDARVPTMIHVPGATASYGARSTALVELVDLFPTLAELAGAGTPNPAEVAGPLSGQSFAHLLQDPFGQHKGFALSQVGRCCPARRMEECGDVSNATLATHYRHCAKFEAKDVNFMGYSLRTDRWRYTEWATWDGLHLRPSWSAVPASVELYDHQGNDMGERTYERYENVNVARMHPGVVTELSQQLRALVDASLLDRTPPAR